MCRMDSGWGVMRNLWKKLDFADSLQEGINTNRYLAGACFRWWDNRWQRLATVWSIGWGGESCRIQYKKHKTATY